MNLEFIVIDTNVFISAALSPAGTAFQAFSKAMQKFMIAQSAPLAAQVTHKLFE